MSDDDGEGPGSRRALVVVAALAFVAVALIVVWVGRSDSGDDSTGAQDDADAESAVFDQARAAEFEAVLLSRDPERLGEVLVVEEGQDLAVIAAEALPPGVTLSIDESTFEDRGEGFGVVDATIGGGRRREVTIFLVVRGGEWMMAGTTAPVPS